MNLDEIKKTRDDLKQAELAKSATIQTLAAARDEHVAAIAEIDSTLAAFGVKGNRKPREPKKGGLSEKAKA